MNKICVYTCITGDYENLKEIEKKEKVKKLLKFYEDSGYKYDNGLIESTVFIKRPKDKKVRETCKIWFDMIVNFSHRDQLSFNYCLWKTGLKVKWIKEKVFHNNWFEFKSHNLAKNIESYRVYFNDINDSIYNMENDFQGSFIKRDNEYYIELIVPCDIKKTVIELSKVPFLKLNYFKINDKPTENVHYFNSFLYKNSMFFYNQNDEFEIYDYLKKGEPLKVNIGLEIVNQEELVNIF